MRRFQARLLTEQSSITFSLETPSTLVAHPTSRSGETQTGLRDVRFQGLSERLVGPRQQLWHLIVPEPTPREFSVVVPTHGRAVQTHHTWRSLRSCHEGLGQVLDRLRIAHKGGVVSSGRSARSDDAEAGLKARIFPVLGKDLFCCSAALSCRSDRPVLEQTKDTVQKAWPEHARQQRNNGAGRRVALAEGYCKGSANSHTHQAFAFGVRKKSGLAVNSLEKPTATSRFVRCSTLPSSATTIPSIICGKRLSEKGQNGESD